MPADNDLSHGDAETLGVYDSQADEYATIVFKPGEELQFLAVHLPQGAAVLDFGAGPGSDAAYLKDAGCDVVALEPVQAFADMIRAKDIPVRQDTFDALKDVDAFDAIIASFSLLHAPRAEFPKHLAAIHRALRPGGQFVLGMKVGTGEHRDDLGRFYVYYSVEELCTHLAKAGFEVQSTRESEGKGLAGSIDRYVMIRATTNG